MTAKRIRLFGARPRRIAIPERALTPVLPALSQPFCRSPHEHDRGGRPRAGAEVSLPQVMAPTMAPRGPHSSSGSPALPSAQLPRPRYPATGRHPIGSRQSRAEASAAHNRSREGRSPLLGRACDLRVFLRGLRTEQGSTVATASETETVIKKIIPYLTRRGFDVQTDFTFKYPTGGSVRANLVH